MSRSVTLPISTLIVLVLGWFVAVRDNGVAPDVRSFLEQHFQQRAAALYAGRPGSALAGQIDLTSPTGRWLMDQEQGKAVHLHAWLGSRGYVLTDLQVEVRVLRVKTNGNTATASVIYRLGLGYRPAQIPQGSTDWMGVGTSHVVELVRSGEDWLVRADHALDPLHESGPPPGTVAGSGLNDPPAAAASSPTGLANSRPWRSGFNRGRAAQYADTYCGIALGCSNGHRYNREYRDFTGLGGDCANFASQVLVAGGLRPGAGWRFDPRQREASVAWINAGALVRYLLSSGRAQLVARGSFAQVTRAAGGHGLPRLAPGDIIGYERDGDIVHVSVVAASNSAGYAVVNSHTADRHHVPWDLGWSENTRFWLVQIRG